jgi:hypothetical protein
MNQMEQRRREYEERTGRAHPVNVLRETVAAAIDAGAEPITEQRDNPYTARIAYGGPGFDVVELVTGPAETIANVLHVRHHDGFVSYCRDWAHATTELVRAGVVGVKHGPAGTYGHTDLIYQ